MKTVINFNFGLIHVPAQEDKKCIIRFLLITQYGSAYSQLRRYSD
jgi:hypothetical protein